MRHVLILGDGNFSFTLSLVRGVQLLRNFEGVTVVATSFDEHDELLKKYPEWAHNMHELAKFPSVVVKHGVNASVSLHDQLLPASHYFSDIIFNFPHVGSENALQHCRLLAHFLHAAGQIMEPDLSVVSISLADEQADRWKLFATAERLGFARLPNHLDNIPFREGDFDGYELKRHQSGKSFNARVRQYACFQFYLYVVLLVFFLTCNSLDSLSQTEGQI